MHLGVPIFLFLMLCGMMLYNVIVLFVYAVNSLFMLFASTLFVDGMNSSCE